MISPARAAAFDILLRVEREQAYAVELLHSSLLDKFSQPDRNLATELVMGVLRWQSRLDEAIASQVKSLKKLDIEVLIALRLGFYQTGWLDKIPPHAAVNDSVELVKRAKKRSAAGLANAVLRSMKKADLREEIAPPPRDLTDKSYREAKAYEFASNYAHPRWLTGRWCKRLGVEETRAICMHDQQRPDTTIRVQLGNTLNDLRDAGIELRPGVILRKAYHVIFGDITQTEAFRNGLVHIQDEASQLVALLVGHEAGPIRILDCCAAPGSKTRVLAEQNSAAHITALELHEHRAREMRDRLHAPNVSVQTQDARTLQPTATYDRVLADVPCSGTGTLARNPEIKWRLRPEDLADLQQRQIAILTAALGQLAPGGRLVYSTCSLEREENEAVVEQVLAAQPDYTLIPAAAVLSEIDELATPADHLTSGPYLRTIPGIHRCDGFFAAVIQRTT